MKKALTILFCFSLLSCTQKESAVESKKKIIENFIEEANTKRETLVKAIPDEAAITPDVFKATCGPVGKFLKSKASEHNVSVKQASLKYRNPKHTANEIEQEALLEFEKDKNKVSFWLKKEGLHHYFRRIPVQSDCLKCHGEKASRPAFIKTKYNEDKAFDFKEGDLRGLYHVSF